MLIPKIDNSNQNPDITEGFQLDDFLNTKMPPEMSKAEAEELAAKLPELMMYDAARKKGFSSVKDLEYFMTISGIKSKMDKAYEKFLDNIKRIMKETHDTDMLEQKKWLEEYLAKLIDEQIELNNKSVRKREKGRKDTKELQETKDQQDFDNKVEGNGMKKDFVLKSMGYYLPDEDVTRYTS